MDVVLVVGDWVIDSYMLLVEQNQEFSSHIGRTHYRVSPPVTREIRGAGYLARILSKLQLEQAGVPYRIVGIGAWNAADTELLRHFFHMDDAELCPVRRTDDSAYILHCDDAPDLPELFTILPNAYTIQAHRLYLSRGQALDQVGRIDHEVQPQDQVQGVLQENRPLRLDWPDKTVLRNRVKAVVVDDRQKGMFLSPSVIDELITRYGNADWYVRAKSATLSWLRRVPEEKLKLLVLGPEVLPLINPFDRWLEGSRMTYQAIELLYQMPGRVRVLLTNNCEVLVSTPAPDSDERYLVMGRYGTPLSPTAPLGWAGGFTGALVYDLVQEIEKVEASEVEVAAVQTPEDRRQELLRSRFASLLEQASRLHGFPLHSGAARRALESPPVVACHPLEDAIRAWNSARKDRGLIQPSKKTPDRTDPELQLWRASVHLSGYVACIAEKQHSLLRIGKALRFFRKQVHSRPVNLLIEAGSGSGKTTLARSLAKAFDFEFVETDISAMLRREELLYLFDSVASAQARSERPILVFVDEVNARLEGDEVYSSFLMPIESGVYNRSGSRISLAPCVWVFAGTNVIPKPVIRPEASANQASPNPKLDDFLQRMSMKETLDYSELRARLGVEDTEGRARIQRQAELEQVYFGAHMIKYYWPDVEYVSEKVLAHFAAEDPGLAPFRKIRKTASELHNVRYGIVREANLWGVDKDRTTVASISLPDVGDSSGVSGEVLVRLVMTADE